VLLGRLRIRGKLILLVVIPLLAVVALTVPVVVGRVQQAGRASDTAAKVRLAGRIGSLVQDLQRERLLSIGRLLGVVDRDQVTAQSTAVDNRIADLRADSSVVLPKALSDAIGAMPDVSTLRTAVLGNAITPDKVMDGYAATIIRLINAVGLEQDVDVATREGRQVVALDAALRTDEGITYGATYLPIIVAAKNLQAALPYYANLQAITVQADRLARFATPAQMALYVDLQKQLTAKLGSQFASPTTADPAKALGAVPLNQLFPAVQSVVGIGQVIENRIIADVTKGVEARKTSALTTAYLVGGLTVLVLLIVLLLSIAVVRAVVRPLTSLTVSADRVARVAEAELVRVADDESEDPEPIHLDAVEVSSSDEIGELARAFERVQNTAAGLVERQVASRRNVAQMFAHVGRRTQNLVARQVALVNRLEREETDPDRRQQLQRLDHVSSRLRRNARSLVVLSGTTGVDEQTAPLPLADVVRLAMGEIEDASRVDVLVPPDVAVVPAAVNDLTLLLAELMENASAFSPPHVRVTVTAQALATGVQVDVVDHGIGLAPDRLEQENARLDRRERLDLAPSEVLGLFVVGRLARRHHVGVRLAGTPGGGVTATVHLHSGLLTPTLMTPASPAAPALAPIWAAPLPAAPISGAPISAAPVSSGALMLAGEVPFDEAAVYRASRSIATSQPWSAFIPHQRAPEPSAAPEAPAAPRAPLGLPAGPHAGPIRSAPQAPSPTAPQAPPRATPQPPPRVPAHAGPVRRGTPPLTRREPGVTLQALQGAQPGKTRPVAATPSNPDEVRDLIEQFEAGVTRALRDVRTDQ
jgi:signal transduction histidine kinase